MSKIVVFVLICMCFTLSNSQNQCKTPDGHNANCVKLQKCPHLSKLLTTPPLSEENKLFLQKSQCGFYQGHPYVCCGPPKSGGNNLLPKPGKCGTFLSDRIFGGEKTQIDEFPWMALIEYTKDNKPKGFHCGGVLINHNYVITAAHCIKAIPRSWALSGVRLGEWDTSTDMDCITYSDSSKDCADPPQDIPISEIIVHERYGQTRSQADDIALLRLSQKAIYSYFVQPICLPTSETLQKKNYDGERLTVAGWGRTETTSVSDIKLKLVINGVSLAKCNEVYNTKRITISSDQICAGGEKGLDSCRGDSGGPLMGVDFVADGAPYWTLVGLVSFGPSPCGKKDWPGVYTKVGPYIDWIESKLVE